MDKVRFALTTIAALAAAPAALAQSTGAGSAPPSTSDPHAGHTMTPPSSSTTTSSAGAAVSAGPTGASVQTAPPTTTTTTPGTTVPGTMGPGAVQTSTPPPPVQTTTVPVGTTRITQAEMLPPSTTPATRETVTVKQSFRPNRPLLITGSAMFVGSYATTAALTGANSYDGAGDRSMYIPVVGPWMHLASFSESGWDQAFIIGSGIVQGAGIGLAVASLFFPENVSAATIPSRQRQSQPHRNVDGP